MAPEPVLPETLAAVGESERHNDSHCPIPQIAIDRAPGDVRVHHDHRPMGQVKRVGDVAKVLQPGVGQVGRQGVGSAVNLWKVTQDMDASMRCMLERYRADVAKDTVWRTWDDVFLSIIVASSNDDYISIRARLFASTHHLSAVAKEIGLDYELIIVQYNPSIDRDYFGKPYNASTDDELSLSQLLPVTVAPP